MLAWLCLCQGADLHMVQLMPLPLTTSCASKSRLVLSSRFTFLVPAHPGSPGQSPGGHKMVVVVVVVVVTVTIFVPTHVKVKTNQNQPEST